MKDGYNVLSDEAYRQQMFEFDLQLFGGGGGGKGGVGKVIGMIAFAAIGFYNPAIFGLTGGVNWGAAVMGAALFSSVWSATHRQSLNYDSSTSNIQRFERAQETMSSDGQLPVVYGRRQITGNQTYHKADSDATTLWKHVVLCEGGIEGIESVTANDLIVPTGSQTSNTVFTLRNVKYEDATVYLENRTLKLYANGKSRSIYLCTTDDMTSGNSYWDYQVSVSSLISYINRLGEGWQAFPIASTNQYPGNLWDVKEQTASEDVILTNMQVFTMSGKGLWFPGEFDTFPKSFWFRGYYYEKVELLSMGYCKYRVTIYDSINVYQIPANFQMSTVSGGTSYTLKDCVAPSNYEEVGGYPNMAWLDMKFVISSELNGNPSVSCLVKGRKVYDVRTGKTAYSTNPALCVRDFLLSKRYGMGKWFTEDMLDEDSWKEAADYCDEIITFLDGNGAQIATKRYELNMVIDTKRTALEWLQEMLANFCGYIVYSSGKLKLKIEKETPISYKFDDDSCKDLKISPLALSETPNRYEVSIIDPLNNWSTVKCICDDYADQKQRQKIISKSVSLEGVTSQNQALRLARFYRDYNLVCPMQLSFSTGMQAMHLEPGDVVTISYHGVFKDMPIRISEIKETNKGTFEISGRQYNDTIYGDILSGGIHWHNYSEIPTPYAGEIPNVQNLEAKKQSYIATNGSMINTVTLTWDELQYQFLGKYVIENRFEGIDGWTTLYSTSDTKTTLTVNLGWKYDFRVQVENTAGRLSSGTVVSDIYIDGYNEPPAAVQDITYEIINGGVSLKWKANDEPDIKGYNVYQGNGNVGFDGCELVVGCISANTVYIPSEYAQNYTFYITAVDTAGNESTPSAPCLAEIEPLGDVENFFGVKNGDTIQFFWDEIKNCNYEIRWGSSWATGKTVAKVNSNVYTLFFPLVGTQTFFIKAYNGYNMYSKNATWLNINCTPEVTRNIIADFDEGGNGWLGSKVALQVSGSDLVMKKGATVGEYYTNLHLNKTVESRNWIEYAVAMVDDSSTWASMEKQWVNCTNAWVNPIDEALVRCENYISTKTNEGYLYSFNLDKNTDGAHTATGITYADGRFASGAVVGNGTVLDYKVSVPQVFNMAFNVRIKDELKGFIIFATLATDGYWLRIEYHNGKFALMDSKDQRIELDNYCYVDDVLNFSIVQTATERTFKIINVTQDKTVEQTKTIAPIGEFTELRLRA